MDSAKRAQSDSQYDSSISKTPPFGGVFWRHRFKIAGFILKWLRETKSRISVGDANKLIILRYPL